jgi:O-antigen/teichoic acid export membrane protein
MKAALSVALPAAVIGVLAFAMALLRDGDVSYAVWQGAFVGSVIYVYFFVRLRRRDRH